MPKRITAKNFRRYGWVIEYPNKKAKGSVRNLFRIVLKEEKRLGWRIAYLIVRDRRILRMEQHPESFESFEPIRGKSLLYVTDRKDEGSIECFVLDRPIILKKGIWHGVVTLGKEAEMKLTENADVECVYWRLISALPIDLSTINDREEVNTAFSSEKKGRYTGRPYVFGKEKASKKV